MKLATLVCLAAVASAAPARADNLRDLVDRADRIYRGKTSAAVFEMEIVTRSYHRTYKAVAWDDSRKGDHALIKILGPALWRGFGTLKLGNKLKLYDPKTHHVTLVGHSMLGDSWMGSHFSNDDLVKETRMSKDYELALERTWTGDTDIGKATLYRVKLTPKPSAPVVWGRIVFQLAVRGDVVVPQRAEYYRKARQKKPSRVVTFADIKTMSGRTLPAEMTMTVARKPGEHTTIRYKKLVLDAKIPGSKFSEQALRK